MDNRPIAIFDSGIGGLTVVKEIINVLPSEKIIYLGDTERCPYGTRSKDAVKKMAEQCIEYLVSKDIKMMIIACNTVTAFAFEYLKKKFSHIPFVGVIEPCVEGAVKSTPTNGMIGIIGTPGTISCNIYGDNISHKMSSIKTHSVPCPLFVPLAEEGILDGPILEHTMDLYLKDLKNKNLDSLILGCTHYPLFRNKIDEYFNKKVTILDSPYWTVREIKKILDKNSLAAEGNKCSIKDHVFHVTDFPERFKDIGENFLGIHIPFMNKINLK